MKVEELRRERELLQQSNANFIEETDEINKHGEYEFQRSQLAHEFRELKAQWRENYYSTLDKKKILINNHSAVVDFGKRCRKMYELINKYRGMTEKQRQDLKINDDPGLEKEIIEKLKKQVDEANLRLMDEEHNFESRLFTSKYLY